jgi:WXG100 family type VII secretion target
MAEILVKPPELRLTAADLRRAAKAIQTAVDSVDSSIKQLGPSRFEGSRADTLRAHYNKLRDAIYRFKPLIDAFANDLDNSAARFESADKAGD